MRHHPSPNPRTSPGRSANPRGGAGRSGSPSSVLATAARSASARIVALLATVMPFTATALAGTPADRESVAPSPQGVQVDRVRAESRWLDGDRVRRTIAGDARRIGATWRRLGRELLPSDRGDVAVLSTVGGASLALGLDKNAIRDRFLVPVHRRERGATDFFKQFGEGDDLLRVAAAAYLVGLVGDRPKVRETGLLWGESMAATAVPIALLQGVLSEDRPHEGGSMSTFRFGGHGASGHAANAMVFSRVLDMQFLRLRSGGSIRARTGKILGKVVLYAVATGTAVSRVRDDKHHAWNVVLGSGVAFYTTSAVVRAHDGSFERVRSRRTPRVGFGDIAGRGPGVTLAWSF